jgi:hypothetical protein
VTFSVSAESDVWQDERRTSALEEASRRKLDAAQSEAFADAVETTFSKVSLSIAATGRSRRKALRKRRRELIVSGLKANNVEPWIIQAVRLGKWVAYLLPPPFNVIVPAVLWAVDEMIKAAEEAA